SATPQPQTPGTILLASFGHPSLQSSVASPSLSTSATPQPHEPGASFNGSFGQPSLQSNVPSPSLSASATPQPHTPATTLFGSFGQPSDVTVTVSDTAPLVAKTVSSST